MRRTSFLALLAVLLLFPSAALAAGPIKVIRDCEDDGALQGNYTNSELRAAQNALPTDIDEYSDCRDVLSRALDAGTTPSPSGNGGGATGATGGSGTPPPGAPGATQAPPDARTLSDTSTKSNELPAPYTPADHSAIKEAGIQGGAPVKLDNGSVLPGSRLAAGVGRNSVPPLLIAVLVLLAAGLAAAARPFVRRVIAERQP